MKSLLADRLDKLAPTFSRSATHHSPPGAALARSPARTIVFLAAPLLLVVSLLAPPAIAQDSGAVAHGLSWLQAQVGADGALTGEAGSVATPLQARSEANTTLRLLATAPTALGDRIAGDGDDNTEYLARQVVSLALVGPNASGQVAELVARQNEDGGFGAARGFASNPLDTAWALLALNASKIANPTRAGMAVSYLLGAQDASGGYGMPQDAPSPYVSALVATALQSGAGSAAIVNALNRLNTWLRSQQDSGGGWGGVAHTSSVYLAMMGSGSDSGLQSTVKSYLLSQQGADGGWGADPYASALALRALVAQARPVPTTGNLVLRVVDAATGQPITAASAILQGGQSAPSLSDASGKIVFSDIPAGSYSGTLSAAGYSMRPVAFSLLAGATVDLGTLGMAVAPSTGMLKGVIKDGANGTPVRDAIVTVTGGANATAFTLADGSFSLAGLAPGAVTIVISKSGYSSVTASADVVAGATLVFSPALTAPGQQNGSTGSLFGKTIDATSLAPLSGVTVTVGASGMATVSGADGRFSIPGIPAGTYAVNFTKPGYASKLFATVLVAGGSAGDFQVLALSKVLATIAVQGTVTDKLSGSSIGQVNVTVAGTTLSARTDLGGNYRIDGLAQGAATLRFAASGYASESVAATFPAFGEYRLDVPLALDGSGNPRITALATDLPSYQAYQPVTLNMQVANNSAQAISSAVIDFTIFDPQGQVVNLQQAMWLDANGVAQDQFVLPPNGSSAVAGKWTTLAYAPGLYQVKARVFTEDAATGAKVVLAERTAAFTIEPTRRVLRLSVVPLPAFTTFDATEQVSFKVEASHQSNQDVTVPFKYVFKTPAGVVLKEEEGTLSLKPNDMLGAVVVGPFPYHFTAAGVYPVLVTSSGEVDPQTIVGGQVQVAPGIRVEPAQQVTPTSVTPDGDKRIRIQLQLKGVEQK